MFEMLYRLTGVVLLEVDVARKVVPNPHELGVEPAVDLRFHLIGGPIRFADVTHLQVNHAAKVEGTDLAGLPPRNHLVQGGWWPFCNGKLRATFYLQAP